MDNQMKIQIADLVIQGMVAVGTIAVAILAIWGEWVRSRLVPPKIRLELHTPEGTLTKLSGPTFKDKRAIYYHLRAVKERAWSPARNCRVTLNGLYKRTPNNQFVNLPLAVPPQYVWAPSELTPPLVTLSTQQIVDFGILIEGVDHFAPVLYSYPNDFQGRLCRGETLRYALEVCADAYSGAHNYVFEVTWDGKWSDKLDEMKRSLIIRDVTAEIEAEHSGPYIP